MGVLDGVEDLQEEVKPLLDGERFCIAGLSIARWRIAMLGDGLTFNAFKGQIGLTGAGGTGVVETGDIGVGEGG